MREPATKTRTPPETEVVLALRRMPKGPVYDLSERRRPGERVWLSVGASPEADIRIDDDREVSRTHALLILTDAHVYVRDARAKNDTLVNGVPLVQGEVELGPGLLVTFGATTFLACGPDGADQAPKITAQRFDEFVYHAARVQGSQRKAARSIGVPRSTIGKIIRALRGPGEVHE